jgi:hypothetical protein
MSVAMAGVVAQVTLLFPRLRHVPSIVTETLQDYVTIAGCTWSVLTFVPGSGEISDRGHGHARPASRIP